MTSGSNGDVHPSHPCTWRLRDVVRVREHLVVGTANCDLAAVWGP